jgi:hypothetical protein
LPSNAIRDFRQCQFAEKWTILLQNQKLSFGEFPSSDLIVELARVLDGDPDELLLLAEKVPEAIRQRVLQRPDIFRKLASLNDQQLDDVLEYLAKNSN